MYYPKNHGEAYKLCISLWLRESEKLARCTRLNAVNCIPSTLLSYIGVTRPSRIFVEGLRVPDYLTPCRPSILTSCICLILKCVILSKILVECYMKTAKNAQCACMRQHFSPKPTFLDRTLHLHFAHVRRYNSTYMCTRCMHMRYMHVHAYEVHACTRARALV